MKSKSISRRWLPNDTWLTLSEPLGPAESGYEMTSLWKCRLGLYTCSVRERAERKVFRRTPRSQLWHSHEHLSRPGLCGPNRGDTIFHRLCVDLVSERRHSRISSLLSAQGGSLGYRSGSARKAKSGTYRRREGLLTSLCSHYRGCNKFCSFCIVPYSRGREKSRTAQEIVAEVLRLGSLGYKEVHLIGQNVNSYRPKSEDGLGPYAGATSFSRLLRAVAATGMERIKFTTSFPRDFHPDIVSAIEEYPNLCDWIHLPVQSGSDRILKAMRRGHNSADYLRRVESIKNAGGRLSLTSDIIVGFPGESKEDFSETLRLVRACEYEALYIFKYSTRPGTPAAQLVDAVPEAEKTERFMALEELQSSIQSRIYSDYVGRNVSVLVEKESARSDEDMMGHSTCHKVVNFRGPQSLSGAIVDVLVSHAKPNSLYGELRN